MTKCIMTALTMLAVFLSAMVVQPAIARDAADQQSFLLYIENDYFAGTDEYYTNAIKITWLSKDLEEYTQDRRLPAWAIGFIRSLRLYKPRGNIHNIGLSLGQNIYTPADVTRADPILNDRPYAGWLYVAVALQEKDATRLDTFEVSLGMVGPASLAEEVQKSWHRYITGRDPKGWKYQLKNEPGIMLTWQQTRRSFHAESREGWGFDAMPQWGATVGNVSTHVNAGGLIRFGYHLPKDFGTSLIRPAGGISTPAAEKGEPGTTDEPAGFHFFLGTEGRIVLRNIFLDGNTFEDSHSVQRVPFVGDVFAGIALTFGRAKISYTHVYRTREFEEQPEPQLFGSITMAWNF